jgi:hypothetical protein
MELRVDVHIEQFFRRRWQRYSVVDYLEHFPLLLSFIMSARTKKPGMPFLLLRQLGHLRFPRPAAFRPRLAAGMALSGLLLSFIYKVTPPGRDVKKRRDETKE